jgi:hypothetical protein
MLSKQTQAIGISLATIATMHGGLSGPGRLTFYRIKPGKLGSVDGGLSGPGRLTICRIKPGVIGISLAAFATIDGGLSEPEALTAY